MTALATILHPASLPPPACSCGRPLDWAAMSLVGTMRDDGGDLELRNCARGSTRSRLVIHPAVWSLIGRGLRPMSAHTVGRLSYVAEARRADAAMDDGVVLLEPDADGCPFGHPTCREDGRWRCVYGLACSCRPACPAFAWRCRTCGECVVQVVDWECVDCAEVTVECEVVS